MPQNVPQHLPLSQNVPQSSPPSTHASPPASRVSHTPPTQRVDETQSFVVPHVPPTALGAASGAPHLPSTQRRDSQLLSFVQAPPSATVGMHSFCEQTAPGAQYGCRSVPNCGERLPLGHTPPMGEGGWQVPFCWLFSSAPWQLAGDAQLSVSAQSFPTGSWPSTRSEQTVSSSMNSKSPLHCGDRGLAGLDPRDVHDDVAPLGVLLPEGGLEQIELLQRRDQLTVDRERAVVVRAASVHRRDRPVDGVRTAPDVAIDQHLLPRWINGLLPPRARAGDVEGAARIRAARATVATAALRGAPLPRAGFREDGVAVRAAAGGQRGGEDEHGDGDGRTGNGKQAHGDSRGRKDRLERLILP
jgi:hypothetical protein